MKESVMKTLIAAFALLAIVALPGAAAAQHHAGKSAKSDLRVSEPIVVGTTTLKPGDYTFQCVEIDGMHYLVVKEVEGKEVARVPCEPETLSAKISSSDFRSIVKDGKRYLTAVRIKGETVAHRVATN
jgi:hypothetical protein